MLKDDFISGLSELLGDIQNSLFTRAKEKRDENIVEVNSLEEFNKMFTQEDTFPVKMGFGYIADNEKSRDILAEKKMSFRCIPLTEKEVDGKVCIFTGEKVSRRVLIGKSY